MNLKTTNAFLFILMSVQVFMLYMNTELKHEVTKVSSSVEAMQETTTSTLSEVKEINDQLYVLTLNESDKRVAKYGLNQMTQEQVNRLVEIYAVASKVSEYPLTLVAISWQESRLNSLPVNLSDPSCGPFHNKVSNVLKREKIEDTSFKRNEVCAKLMDNLVFAIKHANIELSHWQMQHKGNWRKMMASYNGGHAGNAKYSESIAEILEILRASNLPELADSYTKQYESKMI